MLPRSAAQSFRWAGSSNGSFVKRVIRAAAIVAWRILLGGPSAMYAAEAVRAYEEFTAS
jgi:hypothetical protein